MAGFLKIERSYLETVEYRTARPALRFVFAAIAGHANGESKACFPGVRTISEITGYDVHHVRCLIRELDKGGLIKREARPGKSSNYIISMGAPYPGQGVPKVQDTQGTPLSDPGHIKPLTLGTPCHIELPLTTLTAKDEIKKLKKLETRKTECY